MDGNSGIIIVFFILFIQSGLSRRHGSFGYQPTSGETNSHNSHGLGSSFGGSQYNSQYGFSGNNRGSENRRISDTGSWNFADSKVNDNNRKIPSSGNNNNQWNSESGWNSGLQIDWSNSGYQSGNNGFKNNQNVNSGINNNHESSDSASGWKFANEKEKKIPFGQSGIGESVQEGNQRKTNSNRPGGFTEGNGPDYGFNFQSEDTKKISNGNSGSLLGSFLGSNSRKPEGSSSASSSNWGSASNSNSKRPQENSGNSNWNSESQNDGHKTDAFGELGFSSSKENKNQEKPNQNGWNFGSGDTERRPQGSNSSESSSGGGYISLSNFNKHQGSSSIDWGSNINSNFKRPQGGSSSSSSNSNQGFSSESDSKKFHGSSGNSDFSFNFESDSRRPQGSSITNTGSGYSTFKRPEGNQQKPESNSFSKPSSNSRKPPKNQSGSANIEIDKPTGNGKETENQNGNTNRNKTESIDWDNLEKENQHGQIIFDFSELWHADDKKDPAWKSIWTRNRFKREIDFSDEIQKISPICHCVDYQTCLPENRMDINKFFQNYHPQLRVKMMECSSEKKICCITSYHHDENAPIPTCGKRISKLAEYDIRNDGTANYGDHPWILKLVAVSGMDEEILCSASLIHNSIALTTASCALLLTGKEVRIRSGEWNVVGGNDINKMEETTIEKVFLHPDFDVVSYTKDLALLFLNTPFHYNRGANIVCLSAHRDAWDANKCMIVGWMRKNGSGLKSAVLKQVNLEIVAQGKCQHRNDIMYGLSDFEETGFLCAHTQKDDPYLGDVGASLLCSMYNSDAVVQVGFVSNITQRNEKMSTFTDILDSLDWIYRMVDLFTFITGETSTGLGS